MKPDVEAYDRIAKADGSMCITNAAKHLQINLSCCSKPCLRSIGFTSALVEKVGLDIKIRFNRDVLSIR